MGLANVIMSWICCIYYNVIVVWALFEAPFSAAFPDIGTLASYYLLSSFAATLPWETCENWWNDAACVPLTRGLANASVTNATAAVSDTASQTPVEQFWECVFGGRLVGCKGGWLRAGGGCCKRRRAWRGAGGSSGSW